MASPARVIVAPRPPRPAGGPCPRVVTAGVAAATLSGLPSTLLALATGGDLLQSTRAAATLVPGRRDRPGVVAGAAVHVLMSAGWTTVLAAVDRRHRLGLLGGCAAGLLIAALDLEVIGRTYPAIRSLPRLPQWLDHVAFGAIAGALLAGPPANPSRRTARPAPARGSADGEPVGDDRMVRCRPARRGGRRSAPPRWSRRPLTWSPGRFREWGTGDND